MSSNKYWWKRPQYLKIILEFTININFVISSKLYSIIIECYQIEYLCDQIEYLMDSIELLFFLFNQLLQYAVYKFIAYLLLITV